MGYYIFKVISNKRHIFLCHNTKDITEKIDNNLKEQNSVLKSFISTRGYGCHIVAICCNENELITRYNQLINQKNKSNVSNMYLKT